MKRNTDHLIGRGSLAQRFEQGRLARQHCPRSALGLQASAERDALALLAASNDGRIAELLPTRFGRMLASPFAFYRGAATLMAHDLAQTPRCPITVQLCGDAHLSNFCLFASPERRLLFGLNKPTPTTASVSSMASGFVRPAAMCFWAGPAARRWALGADFYVRQLRDMKGTLDVTLFSAEDMSDYAQACGYAPVRTQAKAGDPALIAGYIGKSHAFDRAISSYAFAYADQNEADYAGLKKAVKSGAVQAEVVDGDDE